MNLVPTLVILIVIFGAIGALIGSGYRGRSMAGLFWGALLGPLGWILVALGPDHRSVRFGVCPHCAGKLSVGSSDCPHCKNRVLWLKDRAIKPARSAE